MKIAVVGSGAAGLGAAWALARRHAVTLYEAAPRFGGHAHSVTLPGDRGAVTVDTGFIVYNERNYPNLTRLYRHLGVETQASEMSFAVSLDRGAFEYAGSALGLFGQVSNLWRPTHWRMAAEILRFFREAEALAANGGLSRLDDGTLADYLAAGGYSRLFVEGHLLPMAAAIWSAPAQEILGFPLASFLRFFANHGLLQRKARPQWRSVTGGSGRYVARLLADLGAADLHAATPVLALQRHELGVSLTTAQGSRRFDQVVLACHADQALRLLGSAAELAERQLLGAFRYSDNEAVLHGDTALMPRRRRLWSSWNYLGERPAAGRQRENVAVTYWMNRLQGLPPQQPLFVSLNPLHEPQPALTHGRYRCAHPIFDLPALRAQRRLAEIQGRGRLWYCGSYCGYGFHEDALSAGPGGRGVARRPGPLAGGAGAGACAGAAGGGGIAAWSPRPRSPRPSTSAR